MVGYTYFKVKDHRPLIFNGLLWSLTFIIFLFIFSGGTKPLAVDYIFTTAFVLFSIIPIGINFYFLIPEFLKKEYHFRYSMLLLLLWLLATLLWHIAVLPLLNMLFTSYFFSTYLIQNNFYAVFGIFLFTTTLIKLTEDWFYFNAAENNSLKLKNTQVETQLSALRAQMNPHFLFNALNVIYSMSIENRKGLSEAVLQLSDILRYVIYDSDKYRVSLKEEITLLKNYIEFQNHRAGRTDLVTFNISLENEQFQLYPLLLLPLIENSFKYGFADFTEDEKIMIELSQKGKQFHFMISNKNLSYTSTLDKEYGGVGLENLKNNLALVYPNRHTFEVDAQKDIFIVKLQVNDD